MAELSEADKEFFRVVDNFTRQGIALSNGTFAEPWGRAIQAGYAVFDGSRLDFTDKGRAALEAE